jgi:hypothetical protein
MQLSQRRVYRPESDCKNHSHQRRLPAHLNGNRMAASRLIANLVAEILSLIGRRGDAQTDEKRELLRSIAHSVRPNSDGECAAEGADEGYEYRSEAVDIGLHAEEFNLIWLVETQKQRQYVAPQTLGDSGSALRIWPGFTCSC